jgi:PAS domain S-box-containing protein
MAGEMILVVEDESVVASDHGERLEALGYRVAGTAASAPEAVEKAGELGPDLALVDIRLQGDGDGVTAAAELRRRFGIPTIFLTAYADEETLERARQTEPLGFLIKPFQDRELRATIEIAMQRHRADRAVRTSELRLRTLVELAPDAIALADSEGRITLCNSAAASVLGLGEEGWQGGKLFGFLDRGGNGGSRALLDELAGKGAVHNREVRLDSGDGGKIWIELSASFFRDATGGDPGIVAVFRDVTGRKLAESELVRLSAAVRLAREIIIMTDASGNVIFANDAAAAALSLERDGIIGTAFLQLLAPEDLEKGRLVLAETAKKGSLSGIELEMRRQNGEPVPVELSAAAMGDSSGTPAGFVTISRDIGDKRLAERELRSRLMSYELEEGNIYLVKEAAAALSLEAFRDLQRAGYRGAVLSRTPPGRYSLEPGWPVDCRWMTEKNEGNAMPPRLADIERWLDGFPRCRALLVDRLDYLISENGFKETLHFIHRLGDMAFLMGHVVIISLDPATLGEGDLRALEKETREVVPRMRPDLPREELELLRFVFERGIGGARPTLTDIGARLGLSKPTVRKKVRDLVRWGHLAMSPRGRTKVVELTELGRRIFSK